MKHPGNDWGGEPDGSPFFKKMWEEMDALCAQQNLPPLAGVHCYKPLAKGSLFLTSVEKYKLRQDGESDAACWVRLRDACHKLAKDGKFPTFDHDMQNSMTEQSAEELDVLERADLPPKDRLFFLHSLVDILQTTQVMDDRTLINDLIKIMFAKNPDLVLGVMSEYIQSLYLDNTKSLIESLSSTKLGEEGFDSIHY